MQDKHDSVIQSAFEDAADLKNLGYSMTWKAYVVSLIIVSLLVFGLMEVIRADSLDDKNRDPARESLISSSGQELYASTDSSQFSSNSSASKDYFSPRNLPGFPGPNDPVAVDIAPNLKYAPSPRYPRQALRSYQTGTVWVRILVDREGVVRDAIIEEASGVTGAGFEEAALEVAFDREYEPAYYEYKPVACWVSYQVSFMLKR